MQKTPNIANTAIDVFSLCNFTKLQLQLLCTDLYFNVSCAVTSRVSVFVFTARRSCKNATADPTVRPSVRPSACPSLRHTPVLRQNKETQKDAVFTFE